MKIIRLGTFIVALSIIAGAFGAHGVRGAVTAHDLNTFEKACHYLSIQGLGLIFVGVLETLGLLGAAVTRRLCRLHFWGMLIFSGSLFLLVLLSTRWPEFRILGAITPVGGILMIIAWVHTGLSLTHTSQSGTPTDKA